MAITPVPDPFAVPDAPLRGVHTNTEYRTRADALMSSLAAMVAWLRLVAVSAWNNATATAADAIATAADRVQTGLDRTAAAASAASALNAPGTSATSVTPLDIGSGLKNFTIQVGKAFVPGQTGVLSRIADPSVQMTGLIRSHDAVTGAVQIDVPIGAFSGSGNFSDWRFALTAGRVITDGAGLPDAVINAIGPTQLQARRWVTLKPTANDVEVTVPVPSGQGDWFGVEIEERGVGMRTIFRRNGQSIGGKAEDMVCRANNVGILFTYRGASWSMQPYNYKG